MLRPEGDVIQLLLEMTHFDNGLGLGHFKHLPKQDETAVNDVTDLLVVEGEIVLVGQEKLVGSGGAVILKNDDPEDFVVAHKPYVIRGQAVEVNNGLVGGLSEWGIKLHVVSPIEPLGETLAVFGGDCHPMREQINVRSHVHVHDFFTTRERGGSLVEEAITLDRD